ncbi:hypothetical protein AB0I95_14955 [Micromonospora sp. NPDC049751]|uniref:hypothetical protein n=1 Tax=Micromonospora sp. NPDC049751 TaxID=3154837 RepID=UPI0033C97D66
MEPFASLDDLKARLDWALSEDEERIADSALDDASELARAYGRDWDADTAPRLVRSLVLKACARYLRNPDGYTTSRAGDETLSWSDAHGRDAGSVYFTREEQGLLKTLAGGAVGIYSVPMTAWRGGPGRPVQTTVRTAGTDEPFEFWAGADPW